MSLVPNSPLDPKIARLCVPANKAGLRRDCVGVFVYAVAVANKNGAARPAVTTDGIALFTEPEVAMRCRQLAFSAAALAFASLAACSSAPPAGRVNFSDAIEAALGRRCITVSPFLGAGGPYPANVCGLTFADTHQLDALVKAGLLIRKTGCVYSLTTTGRKALEAPVGGAFCAGHYKLDKLLGWTKPHPNFMYGGKKTSEVTFTYSPAGMAAWARTAAVNAAFATLEELAPRRKARATLVMEHDRWSVRGLRI